MPGDEPEAWPGGALAWVWPRTAEGKWADSFSRSSRKVSTIEVMTVHEPSSTALPAPRRRHDKVLATVALLALALLALGGGARATFTDTQSAAPTLGSGTVALAPVGTSAVNNRLSIGATDLAAGDTVERTVDINNIGTLALSSITLTTSATTSSLLDTDTTNGLQLSIDLCSVAWTEAGPPYTYTCGGSTSSVLASTPTIGTNLALSNIDLSAAVHNYARVVLTLPSTADNTLQNQTSVINFAFTATQRAAQSK